MVIVTAETREYDDPYRHVAVYADSPVTLCGVISGGPVSPVRPPVPVDCGACRSDVHADGHAQYGAARH